MGHKVTIILGSTYRPIMMVRIIEGWPNEPSMIPVEFTLAEAVSMVDSGFEQPISASVIGGVWPMGPTY